MSKINYQKLFSNYSYTIREMTSEVEVDEKTIRRWINRGLRTVPGSKSPILIKGIDFKNFETERRAKRKVKLARKQFYCFTCKVPRYAKRGSIKFIGNQKRAICPACNGKLSRTIRLGTTILTDTPVTS